MATDPLTASAAALIGKLIGEMIVGLKGSLGKKIEEWKTPARIKSLGKKLAFFEQVKTLSNTEKAQKLDDFYLTPKFSYPNGRPFSVKQISDFGIEDHPLIEGIAGQGKSMFMRQLLISELKQGDRLPVLIELRKITSKTTLNDLILSYIKSLGFPEEQLVWSYLAEKGKIVLLLDGFDELADSFRASFLDDVEKLVLSNSDLKLVITTRPEASIRGVSFFRSVKLELLDDADKEKIIKKICNASMAQSLIKGLKKNTELFEMIDTPLFVTLLCIAYRAEQYIPDTTHEFYDLIFNTLLYRHDAFKPGFERSRKSGLGNSQFCIVFESFCFLSARVQLVRMSEERAIEFITEALTNESISSTDGDKYFSDLVKITCLLIQDGNDYQFLHKSIQDYFCARYIERLPDEIAIKFYSKVLDSIDLIRNFNQTLKFLRGIDTYRYAKYFEVPALSYIFTGDKNSNIKSIKDSYSFDRVVKFWGGSSALCFGSDFNVRAMVQDGGYITIFDSLTNYFDFPNQFVPVVFKLFDKEWEKNDIKSLQSDDVLVEKYRDHFPETELIISVEDAIIGAGLEAKFKELISASNVVSTTDNWLANMHKLIAKTDDLNNKLDLF